MLKKSKAWVDMLRTGLAKVIVSTVLVATAGWANAAPTLFDYPINISPGFGEASEEAPGVLFSSFGATDTNAPTGLSVVEFALDGTGIYEIPGTETFDAYGSFQLNADGSYSYVVDPLTSEPFTVTYNVLVTDSADDGQAYFNVIITGEGSITEGSTFTLTAPPAIVVAEGDSEASSSAPGVLINSVGSDGLTFDGLEVTRFGFDEYFTLPAGSTDDSGFYGDSLIVGSDGSYTYTGAGSDFYESSFYVEVINVNDVPTSPAGMYVSIIYEGVIDSDGDTLGDNFELSVGTDPNLADTDGDGIPDNGDGGLYSDDYLYATAIAQLQAAQGPGSALESCITDAYPVATTLNIGEVVYLNCEFATDISFAGINNFPAITTLIIYNVNEDPVTGLEKETDFTPIADLKNLVFLNASENVTFDNSDLLSFVDHPTLTSLHVSNHGFDGSAWATFSVSMSSSLTQVDIFQGAYAMCLVQYAGTDLPADYELCENPLDTGTLTFSNSLVQLSISGKQIIDVNDLFLMPALEHLSLINASGSQIDELLNFVVDPETSELVHRSPSDSGQAFAGSLMSLNLFGAGENLTDTDAAKIPLAFPHLTALVLFHTDIQDLWVLSGLTLTDINIGGTQVSDISALYLDAILANDGYLYIGKLIVPTAQIEYAQGDPTFFIIDQGDIDADGFFDSYDTDADGDGILNVDDVFPLDGSESGDFDGDGVGNASDPDIDNDGILNDVDTYDYDASRQGDVDNNGIDDTWELSVFGYTGNPVDKDDDGDGLGALAEYLAGTDPFSANASQRLVRATVVDPIYPGENGSFSVDYTVGNADGLSTNHGGFLPGLSLRVHFSSIEVDTFAIDTSDGLYLDGLFAVDNVWKADTENLDGDFNTDSYVTISWLDFTGQWPDVLPLDNLMKLNFRPKAGLHGDAVTTLTVRFSPIETAEGFGLDVWDPYERGAMTVPVFTRGPLDIDADGKVKTFTDGILIARALFGLEPIEQFMASDGAFANFGDGQARLALRTGHPWLLDIDGDGLVSGSTDGILLLRRMLGFEGQQLIKNVVGEEATRTTADAIGAYIDDLMQNVTESEGGGEP